MIQFASSLLRRTLLSWFDSLYLKFDHMLIRRAYQLHLISNIKHRTGGKIAFSETAHTIGIFQTLIVQYLVEHETPHIFDVGCGTGILGIACYPLVQAGANYRGIDVDEASINYAQEHFPSEGYTFQHINANNALYATRQSQTRVQWQEADNSYDLITALSVWTHFNEQDARFYLHEVARVLKPGCHALLTFFILDEDYRNGISKRRGTVSPYHGLVENKWIFDTSAYDSENWYHPVWANTPEEAIAVTRTGLDSLLAETNLKLVEMYPGHWREQPGIFFQDILVLQKPLS